VSGVTTLEKRSSQLSWEIGFIVSRLRKYERGLGSQRDVSVDLVTVYGIHSCGFGRYWGCALFLLLRYLH
jgi:hypothetical protein